MSAPSSSMFGNIHNDVLSAKPESVEDKARLLEELKRRAKLAITSKNYPEAAVLYTKTIEITSDNKAESAILHSNRSLCLIFQGKFAEAKEDAESAVKLDPSYVKGYFRLGSACTKLCEYSGAVQAFQSGLDLDTGNKAMLKELNKAKKSLVEQEEAAKVAAAAAAEQAKNDDTTAAATKEKERSASSMIQKKTSSVPGTTATKTEKNSGNAADVVTNDAGIKKSDVIRGYKIVNGKKTSFFHHEQTEEEKALIGDITPKLIDANAAVASSNAAPAEKGVSAWNTAGTWEEKDVTAWAKETLEKALLSAEYTLPPGSAPDSSNNECPKVHVTKVKNVSSGNGHASVATVRGKRRHIFEFTNVEVHWEVELGENTCSGIVKIVDIDGTCDGEYDVEYSVNNDTPLDARHLLQRFVKGDPDGFVGIVKKAVDDWIDLFRDTYAA
eukprot:CAMPEP_0116014414 /NCGR_PEP_ID=MMETSP0321-20121206/6261_1 /TAXON_ID=163516 /ORGANISM="Leptocylindrus danicus var. danicus, Strain B650" /LENGTH=441 /DNA_ID=CAMNT_0003484057 /DNA_START=59 /DNA_END=1384 /DNA_ORIENTATION=+